MQEQIAVGSCTQANTNKGRLTTALCSKFKTSVGLKTQLLLQDVDRNTGQIPQKSQSTDPL
jgi:hypothetical protein